MSNQNNINWELAEKKDEKGLLGVLGKLYNYGTQAVEKLNNFVAAGNGNKGETTTPTTAQTTTPTTPPATDWEKYYADEKARLGESYASDVAALDKSKQASSEMAAVTRERLMKYLPSQLKAQGIHTQGISEDASIKAFNNYQNAMAGIAQNYDANRKALSESYNSKISSLDKEKQERKDTEDTAHLNKYLEVMAGAKDGTLTVDDINSIASVYGKFTEDEIASLISASENNYEEISNIKSYPETFLADTSNYDSAGNILPEKKEEIEKYLNENRDVIGESAYNAYMYQLGSTGVATPTVSDEDLKMLYDTYNVDPNGTAFDIKTTNADALIESLDVSKGKKQTEHVQSILNESATWGEDMNGTIRNFNYGLNSGNNKGNYLVFYNGKWYPTKYTKDDMFLKGAADKIEEIVGGVGDAVSDTVGGWVDNAGNAIADTVGGWVDNAGNAIKGWGNNIWNGITGLIK